MSMELWMAAKQPNYKIITTGIVKETFTSG